jgi:CheY-like chemotaxis protein
MFSQVNTSIDRAEGGLGIGLALVKGLVRLHGGTVEVRSEGPGCGSEFLVHLPSSIIVPSAVAPRTGGVAELAAKRSRATLLIVDDNRDAAETLGTVLRFGGYDVTTVFSGTEALACAARIRPDVIVLDIGMPEMDGYEIARRMRLEAWGRHAFLIALTGWGQEVDKETARAAGFDRHLTKPTDPAQVEAVLADMLADQRPPFSDGATRDPTVPQA